MQEKLKVGQIFLDLPGRQGVEIGDINTTFLSNVNYPFIAIPEGQRKLALIQGGKIEIYDAVMGEGL